VAWQLTVANIKTYKKKQKKNKKKTKYIPSLENTSKWSGTTGTNADFLKEILKLHTEPIM